MSYTVFWPQHIAEPLTTYRIDIVGDWGNTAQQSLVLDDTKLVSVEISNSCFAKSDLNNANYLPVSVGQANAGEISFSFLSSAGTVYRTSLCHLTIYQIPHGHSGSSAYKKSKTVATYRVDQVTVDTMTGITTVHGFDKMADLDLLYFGGLTGDKTDIELIDYVCTLDNFVKADSVTNAIVNGYTIAQSYRDGLSCRELLAQIAGAYGGAFYLTPTAGQIFQETLNFTDIIPNEFHNYLSVWGGNWPDPALRTLIVGGDRIIV